MIGKPKKLLALFLVALLASSFILVGCGGGGDDDGCDASIPIEMKDDQDNFSITVNCQWKRQKSYEEDWTNPASDNYKQHLKSILALANISAINYGEAIYGIVFKRQQYDHVTDFSLESIVEYEMTDFTLYQPDQTDIWEPKSEMTQWQNDAGQKGYSFVVYQYSTQFDTSVWQTVDMYIDEDDNIYVLMMSTPTDSSRNSRAITIRKSFTINAEVVDTY